MVDVDADAFWSRVDRSGECWLWTREIRSNGYGRWQNRGRVFSTHRLAFELQHGPIPDGLYVLHTCDTKLCCRGDHLVAGTPLDNMRDKMTKGRWKGGRPKGSRSSRGIGEAHHGSKLTTAAVAQIRAAYVPRRVSMRTLAARYGVSFGAIQRVIYRTAWR